MVVTEEAIFRSAEMSLVQFFIPLEVCRETMYTLGNLSLVQFNDLNKDTNAFQRSFVKEIRRLDEVERQYRFFEKQLTEYNIPLHVTYDEYKPADIHETPKSSSIDDLVENAQILEQRLTHLIDSLKFLQTQNSTLLQQRAMLEAANQVFLSNSPDNGIHIDNVEFACGLIATTKIQTLEQILWRSLRGNLLFKSLPLSEKIYDSSSNEFIDKSAFICFTHGSLLLDKAKKISESMDAVLFDVDYSETARNYQLIDINKQLEDISSVLTTTDNTLQAELIALSEELKSWELTIKKEKAIYTTLNLFNYDNNRKILVAEGWVPTSDIPDLKYYLSLGNGSSSAYHDEDENSSNGQPEESNTLLGNSNNNLENDESSTLDGNEELTTIINVVSTNRKPPTFHRVNKLTSGFQAICDAYGVATYREVNPGLATIITFPFMFAIMFGDLGHGIILSLIGLSIVLSESKLARMERDDIIDMAYSGRYIVLMMGLFSIYTGFMYNDVFSLSMTFFSSGWKWPSDFTIGDSIEASQVGVYAAGIDPAWHGSENGLLFLNSYKMKLSIVMGYLHMLYSLMFSLVNYLHFDSFIDIVGNFIPSFLFMNCIFGYLTVIIVYKWCVDWIKIEKPAPSLLNTLISMFLSPGTVDEELFSGQAPLQVFFIIIALICVPCLLFIKPLYLKRKLEKEAQYKQLNTSEEPQTSEEHDEEEEEGHGESFGDIMIHQVIHTIEFCLNCVSHTASYLRLWALSLAHAQLSQVLWSMTLANSFGMGANFIGITATVLLFGMWFVLTCCVLVAMEGTSAMLHSLRLHWVESMSKFFEGEGYAYVPFGFN